MITEKPWGHEELWAITDVYAGKLLFINAGESLSLQYHERKVETLRVMSGRLLMSLDGNEAELEAGAVAHIEPPMPHRMAAIEDCVVLEVSTPELDDVVRLEDRYGRIEHE